MRLRFLTLSLAACGLILSGCAQNDWHERTIYQSGDQKPAKKRLRNPPEEDDADEVTKYEGLM